MVYSYLVWGYYLITFFSPPRSLKCSFLFLIIFSTMIVLTNPFFPPLPPPVSPHPHHYYISLPPNTFQYQDHISSHCSSFFLSLFSLFSCWSLPLPTHPSLATAVMLHQFSCEYAFVSFLCRSVRGVVV